MRKKFTFSLDTTSFLLGILLGIIFSILIGIIIFLLMNRQNDIPTETEMISPEKQDTLILHDSISDTIITYPEKQEKKDNQETQHINQKNDIEQKKSQLYLQLQNTTDEVNNIERELILISYLKNYVYDPVNKEELIPSNVGINDDNIQSMILKYNSIVSKYKELKKTVGSDDLEVKNYRQQMDDQMKSIGASLHNLMSTKRIQLRNAQDRLTSLQRRLN